MHSVQGWSLDGLLGKSMWGQEQTNSVEEEEEKIK